MTNASENKLHDILAENKARKDRHRREGLYLNIRKAIKLIQNI